MTVLKPLQVEFVAQIRLRLIAPLDLGRTGSGIRRIGRIVGGEFEGAGLSGKVLEGGADWQIVRDDGIAIVDARYMLQAHDGALIAVYQHGMRRASPEVIERLASGQNVDPSEYYFRSTLTFETSAPQYAFLEQHLFAASCHREGPAVLVDVSKLI